VIEALSDGFAQAFAPVVDAIRARGPCVVLVGMGSPKQEGWARAWLEDLEGVVSEQPSDAGAREELEGLVAGQPAVRLRAAEVLLGLNAGTV
jgi:hypothetical protein